MTQHSGGQPGGWNPNDGYEGFYAPPASTEMPSPNGPRGPGPAGAPSATESLKFGWRAVFGNFTSTAVPLVVAYLAYLLAGMAVGGAINVLGALFGPALGLSKSLPTPASMPTQPAEIWRMYIDVFRSQWKLMALEQPLGWVTSAATAAIFIPGMLQFSLKVARDERPEFSEVFAMRHFVPVFVATLLVQLLNLAGFVLCVIPMFVVMTGTCMYVLCIVDGVTDGVAAIRESWRITSGNRLTVFLFFVLAFLLTGACFLACCLPALLIGAPVTLIGMAHMYAVLVAENPPPAPAAA